MKLIFRQLQHGELNFMQGIKEQNKEPLYALIKSLNSTEKAYFKKFVGADENSNYLKLFDAINSLPDYDEEKILKKFRGEKFGKNLSVSKSYLFELIMDSLRSYHRNRSFTLKAENMLGNLRILQEKGLTEIFEKQLEKAKEFAESNELTFHFLEMLELERPHNFNKTKSNVSIQQKQEEELIKILNRIRIAKVNEKILNWLYKNEKVKNAEDKKALDELIKDPICYEAIEHFNFTGKNSFYSVWSFYYYALGDFEKSLEMKERQLSNYQENPVFRKGNEKYMLLVLGNILSICHTACNKEKFSKYFSVLLEEHKNAKENELLVLEQSVAFSILHYLMREKYEEGAAHINDNEERILNSFEKFSLIRQLDICYNSVIIFFKLKDFRSALKWLNRILQNKNLDDREFMHCYTRIMQLMLHYEMNNTELVNSLLRSTFRYLSKRQRIYDFEEVMLGSMKKIIQTGGGEKTKEIFTELKAELEKINADPYKKHAMDHFDYISWLNDKLQSARRNN